MAQIFHAYAKLDDREDIEYLLKRIPTTELQLRELREELVPGSIALWGMYDFQNQIVYYVKCDGDVIACYAISDIVIEENAIRKECNIHGWSVEQLQAAVERITGKKLERGPMRFLLQVKLEPDPTSEEVDQAIKWIEKDL
jgi:hypothetical protein